MNKIDMTWWLVGLAWGGVVGLFYFGGLWWTLKRVAGQPKARLWLGISFIFRTLGALLGFWLVLRIDHITLFFALAGFFVVRFILTRKLGRVEGSR